MTSETQRTLGTLIAAKYRAEGHDAKIEDNDDDIVMVKVSPTIRYFIGTTTTLRQRLIETAWVNINSWENKYLLPYMRGKQLEANRGSH